MASSDIFFRATFNRLKARIEQKIVTSVNEATIFMKNTPQYFKNEWDVLKEEINDETIRLENIEKEDITTKEMSAQLNKSKGNQEKIDHIRKNVKKLIKNIEELH